MPHEHRPAGRLCKTTNLYPVLKAANAEFAVVNGWERLDYIKPSNDFEETHSFKFNNTFELVGKEVALVQNGVGLCEVNGFNRFEITGTSVHDWLDGVMCSRVPRKVGKIGLAYFLNHQGNIKGEATLANLEDNKVWYGSAAAAEFHDMDWLSEHLPDDGSIQIQSLTNSHAILIVAGPNSRAVLQAAAPDEDWNAFPWLSLKQVSIGGTLVVAMAVSFSGELAWELHVANEDLKTVHDLLMSAGQTRGIGYFGLRAVESMRLEKGFRHWKADLITEFNPYESGLERFVKMDKEFIGKAKLIEMQKSGPRRGFASLVLDSTDAPAHPGDSIISNGRVIGTITSAAWGYRVNKNIAWVS